jgi:large subunit ribosomal protein L17
MRKKIVGRKFSRSSKSRRALLRALVFSLVNEGKITTTLAKAKEITRVADKLFAKAKKGTLSARRQVLSKLANNRKVTDRIFEIVSSSKRVSGFVKFLAIPPRRGDSAPMAQVEIIDWIKPQAKENKETKKEEEKTEKKNKESNKKTKKEKK